MQLAGRLMPKLIGYVIANAGTTLDLCLFKMVQSRVVSLATHCKFDKRKKVKKMLIEMFISFFVCYDTFTY